MKKLLFILIFLFSSLIAVPGNADSVFAKTKTIRHENTYELVRYYDNGSVEEIQFYSFDKEKTGTWIRYSETGKIMSVANFKHDKKDGEWKIFDDSGKMIVYINYVHGKRNIVCTINEQSGIAIAK